MKPMRCLFVLAVAFVVVGVLFVGVDQNPKKAQKQKKVAGTQGDVLKVVQNLPGVSRPPVASGQIVVWGSAPRDTRIYVDGVDIPALYHGSGLRGAINSDLVASIDLVPGAFGAEYGRNSGAQVSLVTRSGGNDFHGSAFEFIRNDKLDARSFFAPVRPTLRFNNFGYSIGGPIFKDKLFFFGHYEGFRQETGTEQNITIPANADFINGVFRYVATSDGTVRSVNVLQLSGLAPDPIVRGLIAQLPDASKVNNFERGNSTAARLLNTAAFRFNQQDLNNRDQFTGRIDYSLSPNHKIEGVFSRFLETNDREDLDVISEGRPPVRTRGPRLLPFSPLRPGYQKLLLHDAVRVQFRLRKACRPEHPPIFRQRISIAGRRGGEHLAQPRRLGRDRRARDQDREGDRAPNGRGPALDGQARCSNRDRHRLTLPARPRPSPGCGTPKALRPAGWRRSSRAPGCGVRSIPRARCRPAPRATP